MSLIKSVVVKKNDKNIIWQEKTTAHCEPWLICIHLIDGFIHRLFKLVRRLFITHHLVFSDLACRFLIVIIGNI